MEINLKFWGSRKKAAVNEMIKKEAVAVQPCNAPVFVGGEVISSRLDRSNYYDLFYNIPEIAFPIMYLISRMKNAEIVLKRYADDSEVWSDTQRKLYGDEKLVSDFVKDFLAKPNYLQTFSEFTEQYFLQRYLTGSSFVYASGSIDGLPKWRTSKNFSVVPSNSVMVDVALNSPRILMQSIEDYIKGYKLSVGGRLFTASTNSILFTRDIQQLQEGEDIKGYSRLKTQQKCIDNLIEVYEARLAIYNKRGGIGALVNQKSDVDGSLPMTQKEREDIYKEFQSKYGITHGRMPIILLDKPMNYIRMNANINELEPFRETMLDSAEIAGIFQIKKELLPREGNSTYANQEESEISVYNDMIIPEMSVYLDNLSHFLGLTAKGLYLHAKWDIVEVLKKKRLEGVNAELVKMNVEMAKFKAGACTLNEVLAKVGVETRSESIYNKTIFDMNAEELAKVAMMKQL